MELWVCGLFRHSEPSNLFYLRCLGRENREVYAECSFNEDSFWVCSIHRMLVVRFSPLLSEVLVRIPKGDYPPSGYNQGWQVMFHHFVVSRYRHYSSPCMRHCMLHCMRQFQLVMSEVKTFHLMALTRTARDLIALTIRCFHAKKCPGTFFVHRRVAGLSENFRKQAYQAGRAAMLGFRSTAM